MGKSIKKLRHKLKPSALASQKELLSHDLDLSQIAFITRKLPTLRFDEAVVDGEIIRTIEGASTVRIKVNDQSGRIRRSGRLAQAVDIKIDGIWFRLVKVAKTGNDIDLTFECREVAVLRTYNERRVIGWGKMRRVRFAQIIATEPKEFPIQFICPDLNKPKPKPRKGPKDKENKAVERETGFGFWYTSPQDRPETGPGRAAAVKVKRVKATRTQLENMEAVLDQGVDMMLPRDFLVMAIMTGTVEATCNNNPWGDIWGPRDSLEDRKKGSVGFFQQQPGWGTFEQRMNLEYSSRKFYEEAVRVKRANPTATLGQLCQEVQRSKYPYRYAEWEAEAHHTVTMYGYPPKTGPEQAKSIQAAAAAAANTQAPQSPFDTGIDQYQFMRGRPKTGPGGKKGWQKEDSWTCLQRLADEVDWRCFEVGGKIYFTTETHLFKSAPRMRISERSQGVDWIDFDYDIGKHNAQVTLSCRLNRWTAPPGSVIEIFDMGPVNGRWLVNEITRNFFDTHCEVNLKKPRARLPEPKKEDLTSLSDFDLPQDPDVFVPSPGYTEREGTNLKNSLGSGASGIADAIFDIAAKAGGSGVYVGSDLRAGDRVESGNYSDHAENNEWRAARDIGVKGINLLTGPPSPKLDKAIVAIGDALGKDWKAKETVIEDVDFHGFRVQIIWRTPKYGGHMGHIHVGVRDKTIAANRLSASYRRPG